MLPALSVPAYLLLIQPVCNNWAVSCLKNHGIKTLANV